MRRAWHYVDLVLTLMVVGVVRIFAGKEKALEVYKRLSNTESKP